MDQQGGGIGRRSFAPRLPSLINHPWAHDTRQIDNMDYAILNFSKQLDTYRPGTTTREVVKLKIGNWDGV
jgi:23S rRNA maturation-related 3'-5' exoribonuclease YhaM